ncbi:MAG: transposase [Alphaproteobacteria bacterium]|nr:transposase [Alphaproteobacteria bacterium]
MQRYDFLDRQIEDCEARIAEQIDDLTPPDGSEDDGAASNTASHCGGGRRRAGHEKAMTTALTQMMGVNLTATIGPGIALTIASEIGPDFSAFPSAQHFCSWLGVAPGTRISGGKSLPGAQGGQPGRPCAWQPCRRGGARPSSAPNTAPVSPERTRPSRSPPPRANWLA